MKLVIAIISRLQLDAVCAALEKAGAHGITLTEVKGYGPHDPNEELYRDAAYAYRSTPKIRLDIAVSDEAAGRVVEAVLGAARTGKAADGEVLLTEVEAAARVRDGARGVTVL